MPAPVGDESRTQELLARLEAGDRAALDELLAEHRSLMWHLVDRRLDGRLRARVDTSDIVQEAQIEIVRRIDDFLARKPMPFHLWVYRTAHEHLLRQRRAHLDADCRDAGREQVLPDHSSIQLAGMLAGKHSTASQKMMRAETVQQVQKGLSELAETDREVLLLRIFEGLSNQEVAQILDLDPDTASKRYGRALLRLRQVMVEREEKNEQSNT